GVRDLARGCDACVIPSDHETFGLPAIEAMAAGKPVVTTRCGGPETVVTPETGVTVEKSNARALADAMVDVLRHPGRYNAAAIQRYCHAGYGEAATREKWQALLQKLL
ncbi:MAG: glycosyltransferase family 4 protein, partial [Hyphomicrobiales bacterium]